MGTTEHIPQVYIEWSDGGVEGPYTHLDKKYMDNLLSVEVDDSLYQPDMFTVRILDPGINALQDDVFKLGRKIKISIKLPAEPNGQAGPPVVLMKGEITAVEPDLNS